MKIAIKIYFLIILITFTFSADINKSIIDNNISFYTNMLNTLNSNKISNEETNLQKTLLKKIIELKESKISQPKITTVKTQKEYIKLFNQFLTYIIRNEELKNKIVLNKSKLESLKSQIKEQNSTNLTKELFFALYKKENNLMQKELELKRKTLLKIENELISKFNSIIYNKNLIKKDLNSKENQIAYLKKYIENLQIKKERFELLGQTNKAKEVIKKIESLNKEIDLLYQMVIKNLFLEFSYAVKQKNNSAFKLHKKILDLAKNRISNSSTIIANLDHLLTKMEKSVFGTVGAIKGKGVQEVKSQMHNLWDMANKPLFNINDTPVSIFKLIVALLIFIVGFFIGSFYKRQIKKLSLKNKTLTESTTTLIANMGYYLIFLITFFIVLKVLGINLTSIALVAGALSVGIGFGLQNIISNFVSGIILMVERSVKIGDYIELGDGIRGHVVDIKMRSITINTNANIDVIVPNQDLIQNRVINWTMNDRIRRFEIPFGVAYGTNPQKVIDVVLNAVKNSGYSDIYNSKKRFTRVVMTGMGDSSVNFELFVWIKGEETLYPKRTTSRFLILIYNALYENGIEIPFPQQDLHIRSISKEIPIVLKRN